jgi:hypothetical protein
MGGKLSGVKNMNCGKGRRTDREEKVAVVEDSGRNNKRS